MCGSVGAKVNIMTVDTVLLSMSHELNGSNSTVQRTFPARASSFLRYQSIPLLGLNFGSIVQSLRQLNLAWLDRKRLYGWLVQL